MQKSEMARWVFADRPAAQVLSNANPSRTSGNLIDPALVPLLQTILWIAFWVFVTVLIRTSRLFTVLVKRIEAGSPLRAGYFELGAPPALMNPSVEAVTAEGVDGIPVSPSATEAVVDYQKHSTAIAEAVYLVHAAREISSRTAAAPGRYWVKVWLDAYTDTEFNACTRVTYRLHESFKHPIVATEAKEKHFEVWMEICEEFTVVAYVEREAKEPLWLTRFIDLPGGAGA